MNDSKLAIPTEQVRDRLCRQIRAGRDIQSAAAIAGVETKLIYAWLDRGEREFTGAFREFFDAVRKAEFAIEYRGAS